MYVVNLIKFCDERGDFSAFLRKPLWDLFCSLDQDFLGSVPCPCWVWAAPPASLKMQLLPCSCPAGWAWKTHSPPEMVGVLEKYHGGICIMLFRKLFLPWNISALVFWFLIFFFCCLSLGITPKRFSSGKDNGKKKFSFFFFALCRIELDLNDPCGALPAQEILGSLSPCSCQSSLLSWRKLSRLNSIRFEIHQSRLGEKPSQVNDAASGDELTFH